MRYKLPIDRSVNRLVPHYLSGRRFILFVQSCLYPLQSLNERFRTFARERHIEARMTSQVIYFEWFLNYRFGKYIKDGKDRIFIKDHECRCGPVPRRGGIPASFHRMVQRGTGYNGQ